jgi:site-specific DNA-adenine methylase
LKITNESYENLKITISKSETILYLDPPYQGRAGYHQKTFDSEALYKWFTEQEYTCFMSEYNAPFEAIFCAVLVAVFEAVLEATFDATLLCSF